MIIFRNAFRKKRRCFYFRSLRYLSGRIHEECYEIFSVVLLVMVGTVFAVGPAGLIVTLFKNGNVSGIVASTEFWLWIILAYYFIATFISIDKIIGRIYPVSVSA